MYLFGSSPLIPLNFSIIPPYPVTIIMMNFDLFSQKNNYLINWLKASDVQAGDLSSDLVMCSVGRNIRAKPFSREGERIYCRLQGELHASLLFVLQYCSFTASQSITTAKAHIHTETSGGRWHVRWAVSLLVGSMCWNPYDENSSSYRCSHAGLLPVTLRHTIKTSR